MKMEDRELREFFHRNRPEISDNGDFIRELSDKMTALEGLKRMQDAERKKSRLILAVAFCAGVLAGAGVLAFSLFKPTTGIQLNSSVLISLLAFLKQWRMVVVIVIAVSAIVVSLLPLRKSEGLFS